jgi:hypothetical protein
MIPGSGRFPGAVAVRGDIGFGSFGSGVADGEVDDLVEEAAGHDVPRSHVSVADDLDRAAQVPAVPGNHTASGGGRNDRVASCRSPSRAPTAAAPSRLYGPAAAF